MDLNAIVDKLLDMEPDPIPRFVLLREFKRYSSDSIEFQNAYERVCAHPHVEKLNQSQNTRGFWPPFHGYTEGMIRHLLSYGLDQKHPSLEKVSVYLKKVLLAEETWNQFEKQDNVRWWPEMFVPLVSAAMLSLIDTSNELLSPHRQRWASFAEIGFGAGVYNHKATQNAQNDCFGFATKRVIQPFNYYSLLLLGPKDGNNYISDDTSRALVDFLMNEANGLGYVYNNNLHDLIPINAHNRDSRDFWHWIRALSLVAQFTGFEKYEQKYYEWIFDQRNQDGLWEFPKKFDFVLSNSWRGKNKAIDSTIFVLRVLAKIKPY